MSDLQTLLGLLDEEHELVRMNDEGQFELVQIPEPPVMWPGGRRRGYRIAFTFSRKKWSLGE